MVSLTQLWTSLKFNRKYLIAFTFVFILFFAFIYFFLEFFDKDNKHFTDNTHSNDSISEKIFNKIYFSTTTVTQLGFGDILPTSLSARVICLIQMILVFIIITDVLSPITIKETINQI
jgi:hypothetical protein